MDVDRALIRRLESSEANAAVQIVSSLRSQGAELADSSTAFGGALVAMGQGRFVNRAIGVTLDDRSAADVDAIVQFYATRSLPAAVQMSSWASAATIDELTRRGFAPRWFRAMFAIPPAQASATVSSGVHVRRVTADDAEQLLHVYARGFGFTDRPARAISDEFATASLHVADHHTFLATIDGEIAGCGSLHLADGIGWVGGAATLPEHRRRGVQASLIAHRCALAAQLGCALVAATAVPSGDSARNLLHLGFQLVQTQMVVVEDA